MLDILMIGILVVSFAVIGGVAKFCDQQINK